MTESGLRKDAVRNRELLIAAGRRLFAARGSDATLNDIAHEAGVGIGTAYRRFPNKEALFDAIFEDQVRELEQSLAERLAQDDAWQAIVDYLEASLDLLARDRGVAQVITGKSVRDEQFDWQRDRLAPLVNQLVDRAKKQGVIRGDVAGTDLIFIQIALVGIIDATRREGDTVRSDVHELHRRYLWLMLDGLRPNKTSLLPVAALSTDEAHRLLGSPLSN
ncbi:TetR family transcriptional regulator [Arthrobacter sp. JZ12]|uniref:TetR/AcrR family transcriptional regulator n=1 Tax=Arthrobacter sp. JZ12 TaxID=2654190 RepID=UPI002B47179E|nr:TetR/AcrR family transcriptional regulator [Arthrobacter sp. JZ12]WRH25322.1 TetR family transcriptional regulator [Arthrobacter sp. JZ12]